MKVALVQMTVADGKPLANLQHATELIRSHSKADLYLLPELWATGYARDSWQDYVQNYHENVFNELSALAKELEAWIGGSFVVRHETGQMANRFILIAPDNSAPVTYDKVNLFSLMDEDKYFVAGDKQIDTKIHDWQLNLSICYDLRFPAMYRQSALEGSELFLVASQWPKERCHHMVALARARAIENQAYVALCNRIGLSSNDLEFGGLSGIWDWNGDQLADCGKSECIVSAELALENIHDIREKFPFLNSGIKGVKEPAS